ncbi:MAG: DEAD/DEAH box helicase [Spirochaetia bacterium]
MPESTDALPEILEALKHDKAFMSCVTKWEHIPARKAKYARFPDDLHQIIRKSFEDKGITSLYTHQKMVWDTVRSGKNVAVVTPTASGKTLSYNLPVLQDLISDGNARALYLFPTKALSQDQQTALNDILFSDDLPVKVVTYDGDTPDSLRITARDSGRIIISNPDMLHSGILPNHPKWIKFFSSLKYIVIDEVHTYRGVFGSHVTNVMRRLKRIARFYGAKPQFILCSATIGNPGELAKSIIEENVSLIDENGSPSGEKHLILYNPPLVDPVQGIRRGVVQESKSIAARFLKKGIKTIVFAKSRVRSEIIAAYLRKVFANPYTQNSRLRIETYRGGYLPNERREIEKGLRDGSIHGVVSTNALELGIDIGGLDAAVLAGYPGSIASSWQQAGRAGRRNSVSVALVIASNAVLDQFVVENPEYFLGTNPESAWIDPDNPFVLSDHLKCAAFELPIKKEDFLAELAPDILEYLEETGVLRYTGGAYYWADRSYPSEGISLRSATNENVVIINTTKGKHEVIGEMDRPSAKELLFQNAVYLHRSKQYIVTQLDLENLQAFVEERKLNYFTDSLVKRDIQVLTIDSQYPEPVFTSNIGDVLVRSQVAKFKKLKFDTHENIGYGEISLPEEQMHTRAVFFGFPETSRPGEYLASKDEAMKAALLSGVATVLKSVASLFVLCSTSDLGTSEKVRDPHYQMPGIFLFDRYPGGIGLSEGALEKRYPIFSAVHKRVEECLCEHGCPSCIGPSEEFTAIEGNRKIAALEFLRCMHAEAEDEAGSQ